MLVQILILILLIHSLQFVHLQTVDPIQTVDPEEYDIVELPHVPIVFPADGSPPVALLDHHYPEGGIPQDRPAKLYPIEVRRRRMTRRYYQPRRIWRAHFQAIIL